jgi:hypothetical protein
MPELSINSWESWFIFNLRKINTNQYYESDYLNVANCSILQESTTLQDIEHIIITVSTWTAIFLKHLANTSFMASFQAWTEPHFGLSLWACILLPSPTQYLAVYYSGSGFTPKAFLLSGWLLTNVQVNNITTLHDICAHMHLHHIGITSLLSTHLPFFLAGWLTPTHPVGYNGDWKPTNNKGLENFLWNCDQKLFSCELNYMFDKISALFWKFKIPSIFFSEWKKITTY